VVSDEGIYLGGWSIRFDDDKTLLMADAVPSAMSKALSVLHHGGRAEGDGMIAWTADPLFVTYERGLDEGDVTYDRIAMKTTDGRSTRLNAFVMPCLPRSGDDRRDAIATLRAITHAVDLAEPETDDGRSDVLPELLRDVLATNLGSIGMPTPWSRSFHRDPDGVDVMREDQRAAIDANAPRTLILCRVGAMAFPCIALCPAMSVPATRFDPMTLLRGGETHREMLDLVRRS
jgi:hypothetical protein